MQIFVWYWFMVENMDIWLVEQNLDRKKIMFSEPQAVYLNKIDFSNIFIVNW